MDEKIKLANRNLRATGVRVSIRRRGDRLYLRATLPPKPNSGKVKPYQQDVSLGVSANAGGLKFAKVEAKRIGSLLDQQKFTWEELGYSTPQQNAIRERDGVFDKGDAIAAFEEHYFSTRPRTIKSEETFRREYLTVIKHLDEVSEEAIAALVQSKLPKTRTRKRYGDSLGMLAGFLGMDGQYIRSLGRGYDRTQLNPREIPSRQQVIDSAKNVPEHLQWAYWTYAAYGLRPHELYYLDCSDAPMLQITEGAKTGERIIFPFPPEWADNAGTGSPLPTTSVSNGLKGLRMSRKLHPHIPFTLMTLRHLWAITTIEYGLDVSLAAQQMGHSVKVHCEIYHYWITKDVHRRAWEKVTTNP